MKFSLKAKILFDFLDKLDCVLKFQTIFLIYRLTTPKISFSFVEH